MTGFIYVLTHSVSLFFIVLELLMFVRMFLSFLPVDEDSPLSNFAFVMTEPLVIPVRMVLERSEAIQALPIDLSFCISFLLLNIVQTSLPVVA